MAASTSDTNTNNSIPVPGTTIPATDALPPSYEWLNWDIKKDIEAQSGLKVQRPVALARVANQETLTQADVIALSQNALSHPVGTATSSESTMASTASDVENKVWKAYVKHGLVQKLMQQKAYELAHLINQSDPLRMSEVMTSSPRFTGTDDTVGDTDTKVTAARIVKESLATMPKIRYNAYMGLRGKLIRPSRPVSIGGTTMDKKEVLPIMSLMPTSAFGDETMLKNAIIGYTRLFEEWNVPVHLNFGSLVNRLSEIVQSCRPLFLMRVMPKLYACVYLTQKEYKRHIVFLQDGIFGLISHSDPRSLYDHLSPNEQQAVNDLFTSYRRGLLSAVIAVDGHIACVTHVMENHHHTRDSDASIRGQSVDDRDKEEDSDTDYSDMPPLESAVPPP